MFQSNKAQTSLEFVVMIAILILLSFFFISSIYKTFDSTYALHKIKSRTLEVLSENDSGAIVSKINYVTTDNNITMDMILKVQDPSDYVPVLSDYINEINEIKHRTVFSDVSLSISYIN